MTKAELVNAIAIQTGYDKTTIMTVVESAMDNIKKTMAEGDNVYLRTFGSFVLKKRKQKVARDITKNVAVIIPACSVPAFKPSNEFTDMIRKK